MLLTGDFGSSASICFERMREIENDTKGESTRGKFESLETATVKKKTFSPHEKAVPPQRTETQRARKAANVNVWFGL